MPQQVSQKPTVQFNRGLITEAGELTFPEGASVDELNMTLERSGSRRRRLGVAYETSNELGPSLTKGEVTSVNVWENAGGVSGLNFVVVQVRNTLHFYKESSGALSANKESFTVNLSDFNRPSGFGASTVSVQTTELEGILIVASSEINTFRIDYDDDTNTISTSEIVFRFRDFEWQGDTSTYFEDTPFGSATDQRKYDTLNVGWWYTNAPYVAGTITGYGLWPKLSLPPFVGKRIENQGGNSFFSGVTFREFQSGTSLTANGSFILDLYEQDRVAAASTVNMSPALPSNLNTPETSRFKTVATYAGRVFYSGMSNRNGDKIYFSQLLTGPENLGDCFQINDPTSEWLSDLLDTDGGVIKVSGAYNIRKLHVLGPFLIVFAENGVWVIRGVDDVFRASEYSVNKITEVGIEDEGSFVSAEGRPYWWSKSGIHTLVPTEQGSLEETNISRSTIQTFWSEIPVSLRTKVRGAYDAFNARVMWFYPTLGETTSGKLNGVLTFDETLKAFYPWKVSDTSSEQYIVDPFFRTGSLTSELDFNVVDSNGDRVVDSNGDPIVVTRSSRDFVSSNITMLVRDTSGQLTFAEFTDTSFLDWGSANYDSYAEGGYDFTGDLTLKKSPIYVTAYLEVTEEGLTGTDETGYTAIRPSSCFISSFWDFSTSSSAAPQQAYRLKRFGSFNSGSFDYPNTVTTSRLRIRGRGRSFRLRFESEQGKDFHLLGYDTLVGRNQR